MPPSGSSSRPTHLGLDERVTFHGRIPIEDVPAAVARADIGVAPTRRDPFTDVSLSTKVFEYARDGQAGRRVAPADGRADVPAGLGRDLRPGRRRLRWPRRSCPSSTTRLRASAAVARTAEVVQASAWEREAIGYVALVDRLAGDLPRPTRAGESTPVNRRAASRIRPVRYDTGPVRSP